VRVVVVEVEEFLIELGGGFAFHRRGGVDGRLLHEIQAAASPQPFVFKQRISPISWMGLFFQII
jgi:hypothetical protein